MEQENTETEVGFSAERIDWELPNDLTRKYATNFLVQKGENEWYLSFFQISPPIVFGSEKDIEKQLKAIPKIPAKCVAGLILSQAGLISLTDLLNRTIDRFQLAQNQPNQD